MKKVDVVSDKSVVGTCLPPDNWTLTAMVQDHNAGMLVVMSCANLCKMREASHNQQCCGIVVWAFVLLCLVHTVGGERQRERERAHRSDTVI